jgi:hypothetical protein
MVSAAGIEVGSKAANLVLNLIQIAARRQGTDKLTSAGD